MTDFPEKKSGKLRDSDPVSFNMGVSLSGEAKGSQTVLLALGISASIFLVIGLVAGVVGVYLAMTVLALCSVIPIGVGCFGWWKCIHLWNQSQPSIDAPQHPPLVGNISVKTGNGNTEFSMSGTDSLVLRESSQDFLLNIMTRYFSQQPLPTPIGQVQGSPADKQCLREYSNVEAEQVRKQIEEAFEISRRQLGETIRRISLQKNGHYEVAPIELSEHKEEVVLVPEHRENAASITEYGKSINVAADTAQTDNTAIRAARAELSKGQKLPPE